MNLWKILPYLFGPKYHNAVPDPRSREKKAQDHKYGLDVAAGSIKIGEKVKDLPFVPFSQLQTFSCGAHAAAHGRKLDGEETAPLVWYRNRSNYPDGGMYLQEVLRFEQKAKVVSYTNYPTEAYRTEAQANAMANIFEFDEQRDKDYAYVQINPYDARPVFEAISIGYAPTISFFATYNEWSFEELTLRDSVSFWYAPVKHYIKALPNSVYEKDGDLWLTALESAPHGGHVRREVPFSFLTARMYLGAGYVYKKEITPSIPETIPNEKCNFGQKNGAVLKLQIYMVQLGRMAKQHQTGFYGLITASAVLKWQVENLKDYPNIASLGGKWWGSTSIKKVVERSLTQ